MVPYTHALSTNIHVHIQSIAHTHAHAIASLIYLTLQPFECFVLVFSTVLAILVCAMLANILLLLFLFALARMMCHMNRGDELLCCAAHLQTQHTYIQMCVVVFSSLSLLLSLSHSIFLFVSHFFIEISLDSNMKALVLLCSLHMIFDRVAQYSM